MKRVAKWVVGFVLAGVAGCAGFKLTGTYDSGGPSGSITIDVAGDAAGGE
jgi:ABC-type transporter Mla subunit MlaD